MKTLTAVGRMVAWAQYYRTHIYDEQFAQKTEDDIERKFLMIQKAQSKSSDINISVDPLAVITIETAAEATNVDSVET